MTHYCIKSSGLGIQGLELKTYALFGDMRFSSTIIDKFSAEDCKLLLYTFHVFRNNRW